MTTTYKRAQTNTGRRDPSKPTVPYQMDYLFASNALEEAQDVRRSRTAGVGRVQRPQPDHRDFRRAGRITVTPSRDDFAQTSTDL